MKIVSVIIIILFSVILIYNIIRIVFIRRTNNLTSFGKKIEMVDSIIAILVSLLFILTFISLLKLENLMP